MSGAVGACSSDIRHAVKCAELGRIRWLARPIVKSADVSIYRGVGTSGTARSRNVSGRSTANKQRGGRLSIARMPLPKPGTPR